MLFPSNLSFSKPVDWFVQVGGPGEVGQSHPLDVLLVDAKVVDEESAVVLEDPPGSHEELDHDVEEAKAEGRVVPDNSSVPLGSQHLWNVASFVMAFLSIFRTGFVSFSCYSRIVLGHSLTGVHID